jgi:hypothetical protein
MKFYSSIFIFLVSSIFAFSAEAQHEHPIDSTKKVIIKRQRKPSDIVKDSVYYDRVKQEKLDGVYIPRDLYDCFKELDKAMDAKAKETFMAFSDEEVDAKTHGTLGLWLKTRWQMEEGSRIWEYFRKMGVPHPEYAVGIIIQTYHRKLNNRELGVKELVEKFKANWQEKQRKEAQELLLNDKQ